MPDPNYHCSAKFVGRQDVRVLTEGVGVLLPLFSPLPSTFGTDTQITNKPLEKPNSHYKRITR